MWRRRRKARRRPGLEEKEDGELGDPSAYLGSSCSAAGRGLRGGLRSGGGNGELAVKQQHRAASISRGRHEWLRDLGARSASAIAAASSVPSGHHVGLLPPPLPSCLLAAQLRMVRSGEHHTYAFFVYNPPICNWCAYMIYVHFLIDQERVRSCK